MKCLRPEKIRRKTSVPKRERIWGVSLNAYQTNCLILGFFFFDWPVPRMLFSNLHVAWILNFTILWLSKAGILFCILFSTACTKSLKNIYHCSVKKVCYFISTQNCCLTDITQNGDSTLNILLDYAIAFIKKKELEYALSQW